jgi:hypothetical protein
VHVPADKLEGRSVVCHFDTKLMARYGTLMKYEPWVKRLSRRCVGGTADLGESGPRPLENLSLPGESGGK